jgi:putative acetyltransferase
MAGQELPMTQPSNPSSLHIREARLDDVAAVKAIHKAAVWQLCAGDYTPEQLAAWTVWDDTSDLPIGLRPNSDETMWVAEQDGAVAGFASLCGDQVSAVYVLPDHTRQGVGTRLLRKMEAVATAQGVTRLQLSASLTAVPFYQANGYQIIEECQHRLSNGVTLTCVRMSKRFGS